MNVLRTQLRSVIYNLHGGKDLGHYLTYKKIKTHSRPSYYFCVHGFGKRLGEVKNPVFTVLTGLLYILRNETKLSTMHRLLYLSGKQDIESI